MWLFLVFCMSESGIWNQWPPLCGPRLTVYHGVLRNEIYDIITLRKFTFLFFPQISQQPNKVQTRFISTKPKKEKPKLQAPNNIEAIKILTLTYPLTEVVVAACITSDFEDSHAKALIFEDQAATKCLLWCFLLRATWVVANVRTRVTGGLILLQPLAKIEAKLIVTEPIFMEILGSVKCVCVCLSLRVRYSRIAEILIDTSFEFGSGVWPTRDLL